MSGSSTPTSGVTPRYSKVPPILGTVDKAFLSELNEYIDYEMEKIDSEEAEQRYIIFKTVYNRIIEHVTAYKPLLTSIKKEYEDTIEAIKTGQREAAFLHGKLKAMASEPSTLINFRKRGDELEQRIDVIEKDNDRLQQRLSELKAKRKEMEDLEREVYEPPKRELKKDHRLIPGLTLEESTDLTLLSKYLEKLDRQLKELDISFRTRYVSKAHKIDLKEKLDNKVSYRDQLVLQGLLYRAKQHRLKIAVEAAQAYNRVKPPHQTVGDAVFFALSQAAGLQIQEKEQAKEKEDAQGGDGKEGSDTHKPFDDDDPNKEKEAEVMLEYIEKFNELFEDGKYEEAAIHAANSPKGILRTSETLAKFRDVKAIVNGRSPLLAFSEAVMSSVGAIGTRPNKKLSLECVKCALDENRLDLLQHWIAQGRLTIGSDLGDQISDHCRCNVPCKCSCQALAQNVYRKLHLHRQAVTCLLRQGRVYAGLSYARQLAPLTKEDLVEVLRSCPSLQLMQALVEEDQEGMRLLPIGLILLTVLEKNLYDIVLPFIQNLKREPSLDNPQMSQFQAAMLDDSDTSPEQWDSLVTLFQDQGYQEAAVSLLASVTVLNAMKSTLYDRLFEGEESPEVTPQPPASTTTEETVQPDTTQP